MKNLLLLLVSLFMLLPLSTVAQSTSKKKQGTISGTVISGSDKEPWAAASIQLFSMPDTVKSFFRIFSTSHIPRTP